MSRMNLIEDSLKETNGISPPSRLLATHEHQQTRSRKGNKPAAKRRASSKRSVYGCAKCKERHVKCDERQPTCLRCQQADFTCPGYTAPKPRRSRAVDFKIVSFGQHLTPTPVSSFEPADTVGKSAFEFFTVRTLPLLNTFGPPRLWTETALRLIHSAPVLRFVAVAIGLRHQQLCGLVPSRYEGRELENIKVNTRAIQGFRKSLECPERNTAIISLACLLFVLNETLQKRPRLVTVHLQTGLRLIDEDTKGGAGAADRDVVALLKTLNINSTAYHRQRTAKEQEEAAVKAAPAYFGRSCGARCASSYIALCSEDLELEKDNGLEALWSSVNATSRDSWRFVLNCAFKAYTDPSLAKEDLAGLEERLKKVDTALEARLAAATDAHERSVCSILLARCTVASCVRAFTTGYQTGYDRYFDKHRRIVSLLKDCLISKGDKIKEEKRPLFSLGTGIISSLSSTISQCRHPKIRREALELLKQCPRREGVWDADEAYKIGKLQIEFEEQGIKESGVDEDGALMLPPEENRIVLTEHIEPSAENGWQRGVTFKWKPRGNMQGFESKYFRIDPGDA